MKLKLFLLCLCLPFLALAQNGEIPEVKEQRFIGDSTEIQAILQNIRNFSGYYVAKDYESLARSYTLDGKLFPSNSDIIEGYEAIKKRWILPEGVSVLMHKVTPIEIKVIDDTAYDFGYYQGKSQSAEGEVSGFSGKYVILWKKVEGEWKMYVDIWNRL